MIRSAMARLSIDSPLALAEATVREAARRSESSLRSTATSLSGSPGLARLAIADADGIAVALAENNAQAIRAAATDCAQHLRELALEDPQSPLTDLALLDAAAIESALAATDHGPSAARGPSPG